MKLLDYLQTTKVSYFKNVKLEKFGDYPISRILNGIKTCFFQEQVNKARLCLCNKDGEGYKNIKGNLPAVSFCGQFKAGHKADECVHYNNLMVLDIDKLELTEISPIYDALLKDPYIAVFWKSPSDRGFKGLVRLDYAHVYSEYDLKEKHKIAFQKIYVYLLSNYGIILDASGKDISRLCYMSADKNLQIKESSKPFPVEYEICDDNKVDKNVHLKQDGVTILGVSDASWNFIYGRATNYKENRANRAILLYILKKLRKKNVSITDTWENWVKVAFAIASSVHPEKGRELFLEFCRLDGMAHDEAKSEQLIWNAYSKNQGRCTIRTIIYLAKLKGISWTY